MVEYMYRHCVCAYVRDSLLSALGADDSAHAEPAGATEHIDDTHCALPVPCEDPTDVDTRQSIIGWFHLLFNKLLWGHLTVQPNMDLLQCLSMFVPYHVVSWQERGTRCPSLEWRLSCHAYPFEGQKGKSSRSPGWCMLRLKMCHILQSCSTVCDDAAPHVVIIIIVISNFSQTGARVQPRLQPMPAHVDFEHCVHAPTRSPSLQYNGLHSPLLTGWMEGWVGLVGWPILDRVPTAVNHIRHSSGKINGQRPTSWPLSQAANQLVLCSWWRYVASLLVNRLSNFLHL